MWQAYSAHAPCLDVGASPCQTIGQPFLDLPSDYSFVLDTLAALTPIKSLVDWRSITTTIGALLAVGRKFSSYVEVIGIVRPYFVAVP